MTIDIVGVGPVVGTVRWAQAGKFGVQFNEQFDLAAARAEAGEGQRRHDAAALVRRPGPQQGRQLVAQNASTGSAITLLGARLDLAAQRPGR